MNIRIDSESLRYRISEHELQQLLQAKPLISQTPMALGSLQIIIQPAEVESVLESEWSCEKNQAKLRLNLGRDQIKNLTKPESQREGISEEREGLKISLQVDLHSSGREKMPGHEKNHEKNKMNLK